MKLVRDRIPDIIRASGETPKTHIAKDDEYWRRLKEKLHEEMEEFSKDESMEEMADILEVIDAMIAHKRFDRKMLDEIKSKKRDERGSFSKRIVWEGN